MDKYHNTSLRNHKINQKHTIKIYDSADVIISATNYFFDLLKENGLNERAKQIIINNGIDFDSINQISINREFNGILKMVYLGGARNVKGWEIIIEAANILKYTHKITNFQVNVLREVSPESEFRKKIKSLYLEDKFVFHGYIASPKHLDYIANSDLFLLPSKSEGVANTLLEAVGLEKPVLATNIGGTKDIIQHMKNGYLINYSAIELAKGIKFFLENQEYLEKFSRANSQIKKRFDWEIIISNYEKIYLEEIKND